VRGTLEDDHSASSAECPARDLGNGDSGGEKRIRAFSDARARRHMMRRFGRELPRFLAAIWRVFNEYELAGYVASQKPKMRRQLRTLLYIA
jgi:hypothetical protein